MTKMSMIWLWTLTVPLLMLAPLPFQSTESSQFEIKEWPKHLRSDLRGTSIKIVLQENALAGSCYDEISKAYFTAVRQTLTGQKSADTAVQELEKQLEGLVSRDRSTMQ